MPGDWNHFQSPGTAPCVEQTREARLSLTRLGVPCYLRRAANSLPCLPP